MIKEYLKKRIENIEAEITNVEEKIELRKLSINQTKAQIVEVQKENSEAEELFSVTTRENAEIKENEIKEFEQHISEYEDEIENYNNDIEKLHEEMRVLRECLAELKDLNVSRETLENELNNKKAENNTKQVFKADGNERPELTSSSQESNIKPNGELKKKLIFVLQLCRVDQKRAIVELANIIKNM